MIGLVAGVVGYRLATARSSRPQLVSASARTANVPIMSLYDEYQEQRYQPAWDIPDEQAADANGVTAPEMPLDEMTRDEEPVVVIAAPPKPTRRTAREPPLLDVMHEASDLLSHQAIMENFVHHNPWEALQGMDWSDALESVEDKGKFMSPGERISTLAALDPRTRANRAMAELVAPFLDRGLAKWEAPNRERGFLFFFASLEDLGFAPWRAHARWAAQYILERLKRFPETDLDDLAAEILRDNLAYMEENPELWTETTRAMFLDLPGWSGMFKRMMEHPEEGPASCSDGACQVITVRLSEYMAVKSILDRSSIEAQAKALGWDEYTTLSDFMKRRCIAKRRRGPRYLHGMGKEMESLQNPSGLAYTNQNFDRAEKLEEEYETVSLRGMNTFDKPEAGSSAEPRLRPNLQFYTCFDEREESFRRYIEAQGLGPNDIETYGVAGFFNIAIRCKTADFFP